MAGALIQVPPSPEGVAIAKWPRTRVQVREHWSDPWQSVVRIKLFNADHLEVVSITQSVAPTIPRASFKWRSGSIKREDEIAFDGVEPQDLRGWFVRVQLIPEADPGAETDPASADEKPGNEDDTEAFTIFVGYFVDQTTDMLGDQVPHPGASGFTVNMVDQDFVAQGIEGLFLRTPIIGSKIEQNDSIDAGSIDHTLVFNEKFQWGLTETGNRSDDTAFVDPEDPEDDRETYVFSRASNVWTARQIIDYLLGWFGPDGIRIDVGGAVSAIETLILPRVDVSGMNLYQAINQVIDRRRGLGWCIRMGHDVEGQDGSAEDQTRLILQIFTVFDETISVGDEIVPANEEVAVLGADTGGISGRIEIQELRVAQDTMGQIGKIIVDGERIVSCFSLSVSDETLEPAWSDQAEDDYRNAVGASGSKAEDYDNARRATRFDHVFTTFRVPTNWNWKASAGNGGASDQMKICNPTLDKDGRLIQDTAGDKRTFGHRFLRTLPLRKQIDDADLAADFEAEYERPMVFVAGGNGYVPIDQNGEHHVGNVRVLDTDLGLEVKCNPNHALAGSWTGQPSKFQTNLLSYFNMIATVAVRTDVVARIVETIPENDPLHTLHIKVPGAEIWYIVPGTVVGVDAAGQLVRRNGPLQSDPPDPANDLIVRDDTDRLRRVAVLAKAWYGKQRAALTLRSKEIMLGHPVGSYVSSANDNKVSTPLNSVVSRLTWDFSKAETTLQTDYGELDFVVRDHLPRTRN